MSIKQELTAIDEIPKLVRLLANERDLDVDIIYDAIELALAAAIERCSETTMIVRVAIDRELGHYKVFRRWRVVPDDLEDFDVTADIRLAAALEKNPDVQVDEFIEEEIPPMAFGRIAAQLGKQGIGKLVRQAELERMASKYRSRIGDMVAGKIKQVYPNRAVIELPDGAEADLKKEDMLPRESLPLNGQLYVCIDRVEKTVHGPIIFVSRTSDALLEALFRLEVPEVADELIQIKAVARDPGVAAKVAVGTNDGRIDPIGACVGVKGTRIKGISHSLHDEQIHVFLHDEDQVKFVRNALKLKDEGDVLHVMQHDDGRRMDIAVPEDRLAQAIGAGGQNVRLASKVTGWTLNVMSEADYKAKYASESEHLLELFKNALDVDSEVAALLVGEGFETLEHVAHVPASEFPSDFDPEMIQSLQQRARDALLREALMGPSFEVSDEVRELEGMSAELLEKLAEHDVITLDDFADLSADELLEMDDRLDPVLAGQLIMKARAHWFK